MGQSNYIAAAIAIAFFVYITARGSLANYLGIMTGSGGFSSDKANAEKSEDAQKPTEPEKTEDGKTILDFDPPWLKEFLGKNPLSGANSFNPATLLDSVDMFGGK